MNSRGAQQAQRQRKKGQHKQQKRHRDERRWRYTDFDEVDGEWSPDSAPTYAMWHAFFHQTDLRRKKTALYSLIDTLLFESTDPRKWRTYHKCTVRWLESDGVTAEERLSALRRWIFAQLQPLLAPLKHQTGDVKHLGIGSSEESDGVDGADDQTERATRTTLGARSKREQEKRQLVWETRIGALRLLTALVVVCEAREVGLILDDLDESFNSRAAIGGNDKQNSRRAVTVINLVERLALPASEVAQPDGERRWRSKVRQEALRTLAIIGFVMEDKKVMMELCDFIGRHYLKKRPEEEDALDATNKREQSDASDEEDSDAEENEESSEQEESDEQTSSDADSSLESEDEDNSDAPRRKRVKSFTYDDDGDTACALEVCTFLLAMFSSHSQDDHPVRSFISRYREALLSMLMAQEGPDIAGTSLLRMNAAKLLSIHFRLSNSAAEHDDPASDDDSGDSDRADGLQSNDDMSKEGKRRFLDLLQACSSSCKRTRGEMRRRWERRQSKFMRHLWAELLEHERQSLEQGYQGGRGGIGLELADEVEVRRQGSKDFFLYVRRLYWTGNQTENYYKVTGWGWMIKHAFFCKYFDRYFKGLLQNRTQFRIATRLIPSLPEEKIYQVRKCEMSVRKINRFMFEGTDEQTKRYRRRANSMPFVSDHYQSEKRWAAYPAPALLRTARSIKREWRNEGIV